MGKVHSWGVTFFLAAPVPVEQQSVKKAFIFGRIFKGGDVLVKLSFLTTAERADVDIYVEAI